MIRVNRLAEALGFLALAAPAFAQQPSQAQANAIRQACRADYQSHCASVPTGGSAALACLQENASSLSPSCQRAVAAVSPGATAAAPAAPPQAAPAPTARPAMAPREEAQLMRQACGHDYRLFCRGVPLGGGNAIGCLEAHGRSLSPQCRSALLSARQGH